MNLGDFARQLVEKQRATILAKRSRPWRPTFTPATDLGYDCLRRIVYHRVRPDDAAPIDAGLASIFEEGDLHQRDVRAKLAELGAEVLEAERNFRDERLEITGTIDGRLALPSENGERPRRVPLEIKSTSSSPPENEQQWRESESGLLRRYYAQLTAYLYLIGEPEGLALFKSKATGEWGVVPVTLDYQYAETILKKAEAVRDAVRAYKAAASDEEREATLPARQLSRGDCPTCPWRDLCRPGDAPVDPLLVAQDDKLLADLEHREKTEAAAREFRKLDERIKERLKLTAGERFIVGANGGAFLLTKKTTSNGAVRIAIGRLDANQD